MSNASKPLARSNPNVTQQPSTPSLKMFYKHWKKIALALTSFFWSGCDNNSTSPSNTEEPSSSSAQSSSSQNAKSSSSSTPLFEASEDLYGCPSDICGQISSSSSEAAKPNCNRFAGETTLTCDNGVSCEETETESIQSSSCSGDICPKYGVVIIKEKTYKCDDDKTYNESEFKANYDITDIKIVAAKYGVPSPPKSEK